VCFIAPPTAVVLKSSLPFPQRRCSLFSSDSSIYTFGSDTCNAVVFVACATAPDPGTRPVGVVDGMVPATYPSSPERVAAGRLPGRAAAVVPAPSVLSWRAFVSHPGKGPGQQSPITERLGTF